MRLTYTLSREYIRRAFVETGAEIELSASVELDAAALTPAMRAHLVRVTGQATVPPTFALGHYAPAHDAGSVTRKPFDPALVLDAPATDAEAPGLFTADMARWEDAEARRAVMAAERAEARRAAEERERAEAERRRIAAEVETAERLSREAEKATWIAAHGSDFLRRACLAGGYNCQRRYVTERAGAEHPGYTVDFNDNAAWRDRACPSEQALAEAERTGGLVVWLTQGPISDGSDEYDGSWEQEAVVIRQYLGKYDLIRTF